MWFTALHTIDVFIRFVCMMLLQDIADRKCIKCPLHEYIIDIKTGEGLKEKFDGSYATRGVLQRTHDVEIRRDNVFVKVHTSKTTQEKLQSDKFQEKNLKEYQKPPHL